MNWSALLGLATAFAILLLVIQRTEPNRRRFVFVIMLLGMEVLRRYLLYRDWGTEGIVAFVVALLFNVLFWLMIGRHNPPLSSEDEIEVLDRD